MKDLKTAWERMQTSFAAYAKRREEFGKELEAVLRSVMKDVELLPRWEEAWPDPLFFKRDSTEGSLPMSDFLNDIFGCYMVEGWGTFMTKEEKAELAALLSKLGFKVEEDD